MFYSDQQYLNLSFNPSNSSKDKIELEINFFLVGEDGNNRYE